MDLKIQKYSNDFLASHSQILKKMIPQLLLSLSIFSFIISYSSLCTSSSSSLFYFPKFQYYSFSANSFPFLNRILNKNYLFLICNGLLVFLAKTSGLVHPPPGSYDLNDILEKRIRELSLSTPLQENMSEEIITDHDHLIVEEKKLADDDHDRRSEEVSILIAESEDDDEKDGSDDDEEQSRTCWLFYHDDGAEQLYGQQQVEEYEHDREDEDEEEELEEKEELSTQELNQKFEDFIRKMKKEIVVNEARQKVVMLN